MAVLSVVNNGVTVELPAPVDITVGDEIIWSSNTGRTSSGLLMGDIIAEKQTLNVSWSMLTASQKASIKTNLSSGFHPVIINVDGTPYQITAYRGTLQSTPLGQLDDGNYYYRSVTVDIVEQ